MTPNHVGIFWLGVLGLFILWRSIRRFQRRQRRFQSEYFDSWPRHDYRDFHSEFRRRNG